MYCIRNLLVITPCNLSNAFFLRNTRKSGHRLLASTKKPMSDEEREKELKEIAENATLDNPPTGCCQSGCANCVFIVWAEALSAKLVDAGPEIAEKILKMVDDPNLKAYLELELKVRGLKKK